MPNYNRNCIAFLMVLLLCFTMALPAFADSSSEYELTNMYDGSTVNAGKDKGYSGSDKITSKDIHYNWSLGSFFMTGYTEVMKEGSIPVFLVNPDDEIILSYKLKQNIDRLNNDEDLSIWEDENGYDTAFQIEKTNFGRGALFVKFTNYKNQSRVIPHLNYLEAVKNKSSKANVSNLEEGDYEIALDYEISKKAFPVRKYYNYRTTCKFKIRNSSCMIYLKDVDSNNMFSNYSVAENGFSLKYTSFYQRIVVKREALTNNGNGYALTPMQCRAASDGAKYTDPGIYTVTVKNVYTNEELEMVVAVGQDPLTNAYVTSNCVYAPDELAAMLDNGSARVTEDWLVEVVVTPEPEQPSQNPIETTGDIQTTEPAPTAGLSNSMMILIAAGAVALVAMIGVVVSISKKNKKADHLKQTSTVPQTHENMATIEELEDSENAQDSQENEP